MTALKIGTGLELPLDVVTQKLAFLGRTGSGKSYGATKLAELMLDAGAQVITLDPVGIWWGIRLKANGKDPGYSIPVFGGLHGDVPLEPTAGKLIADLIVDRGISAILDVSQFEHDTDKARFAADFADRFFFRKKAAPSAVHVFLEEAQEFVPQNPQKGEERMLHAYQRMVRLGRNFGIGVSIISQRPQDVNKKALNQSECVFAFQTTGPQERKAIDGWIAEKGLELDIAGDLPKLAVGQPHVWSPAWLNISKTIRISKKETYNASATPTVGERSAVRELAPIDLERIRKDMAATLEKAKAEDPKELRRRIQALEQEIRAKDLTTPAPAKAPAPEIQRVPVFADGELDRLQDVCGRALDVAAELRGVQQAVAQALDEARQLAARSSRTLQTSATPAPARQLSPGLRTSSPADVGRTRVTPVTPAAGVSRPQQEILNALAWLSSVGIDEPRRAQVALVARVSSTSSGYEKNLSTLSTAGLLRYPGPGLVALTDAGLAAAVLPEQAPTSAELQEAIYSRLSRPQAEILRSLVDLYPKALERPELADRVNQSETSSGFEKNLSTLRSLGLVDYPDRGKVVARDVLFLD